MSYALHYFGTMGINCDVFVACCIVFSANRTQTTQRQSCSPFPIAPEHGLFRIFAYVVVVVEAKACPCNITCKHKPFSLQVDCGVLQCW